MILGASEITSQIFGQIGDKKFFPQKWPRDFTSHPYGEGWLG